MIFTPPKAGILYLVILQAGAVRPRPTLQNPSWLQCALGCFVELRKDAAWLEGQNELLCMPVAITASTHASASSLRVTARHSWTVDIHLRPLTDVQMQAVIVGLAKRSTHCPEIPSPLPPKSLLLLQLVGGNPQLLCQTMCLLAGSWVVHNQQFPAGRHQRNTDNNNIWEGLHMHAHVL